MITDTPAEVRRTGRESPADPGRSVRSLRQAFPTWVCWYGSATRLWWALPPRPYRHPALIEAGTAAELALRIRQTYAAERRVSANGTNGTNRTSRHDQRNLA